MHQMRICPRIQMEVRVIVLLIMRERTVAGRQVRREEASMEKVKKEVKVLHLSLKVRKGREVRKTDKVGERVMYCKITCLVRIDCAILQLIAHRPFPKIK